MAELVYLYYFPPGMGLYGEQQEGLVFERRQKEEDRNRPYSALPASLCSWRVFYIAEGPMSKYYRGAISSQHNPKHCWSPFGESGLQTEIAPPFSAIASCWAALFLRKITLAAIRANMPPIRRTRLSVGIGVQNCRRHESIKSLRPMSGI